MLKVGHSGGAGGGGGPPSAMVLACCDAAGVSARSWKSKAPLDSGWRWPYAERLADGRMTHRRAGQGEAG